MKTQDEPQPPRLALAFFRWFCHPDFREEIEGDLLEQFQMNAGRYGNRRASRLFTGDVIRLFRPEIIASFPFFTHSNFIAMQKSDWLKLAGLNLLFAVFVLLPFLPGPPNKLSIGFSALGQLTGFFGLFAMPVSTIWAFLELRKLNRKGDVKVNRWNNGFYIALAITIFGAACYALMTALVTHQEGWWVAAFFAPLGILVFWKIVPGIRKLWQQIVPSFNPAPFYLLTIPVIALLSKLLFMDPLAEVSRAKAIRHSEPLIAAIENFHAKEGRYPEALADLQPAYLPQLPSSNVMGVREFCYEKTADAYNLFFWQHLGATEECVMYNKNDRHNVKGHYASGEAGAHWRYYWLD
jgi:hypothetical protein